MAKTRRNRRNRNNRSSKNQNGGAGMLSALAPSNLEPSLPGGLSSILPNDSWGRWSSFEPSYQWGPHTAAPAPLANGGLYTNPQSTAEWASSPFPATQHAFALEAAKVSGLPEVAYHQRPNDNSGASFSPVVGTPITSNNWSASGPAGPIVQSGGKRNGSKSKSKSKRNKRKSKSNRKSRRSH
jgi:hypothetical protein